MQLIALPAEYLVGWDEIGREAGRELMGPLKGVKVRGNGGVWDLSVTFQCPGGSEDGVNRGNGEQRRWEMFCRELGLGCRVKYGEFTRWGGW